MRLVINEVRRKRAAEAAVADALGRGQIEDECPCYQAVISRAVNAAIDQLEQDLGNGTQ